MERAQKDMERQLRGGSRFGLAGNKLVAKRAAALAMAAALVATPAVAFADQQAQAAQPAATQQATADPGDNDVDFGKLTGVATVNDTSYPTVQDAVDNAKPGDTVTLVKDVTDNVTVTVNKKLTFQREGEVTFSGTLKFVKGSAGSHVNNLAFVSDGTHDSVVVYGVDASQGHVVIQGSTFSTPSRADKVNAQPNAVRVAYSKGVEVNDNTFNLGRISGTSNVAVNAIGNGVGDLNISGNTLNVGVAAQGLANEDGTVDLLIAMGNNGGKGAGGVQKVTVSNNTFDGSQDNGDGTNNRFAGLSEVKNITFEGNTVKNAARGIAQSGWDNQTYANAQVHIGEGNTFTDVASPFEAMTVQDSERTDNVGATVLKADGTLVGYNWIQDAVKAVNDGGKEFDGATIAIQKSVDTHPSYTLNKKVTFTAPKIRDYTFNGSLRLNQSGSAVKDVHFVLDGRDLQFQGKAYKSGLLQSVILSNHAEGIEVSGNTFDLPSLDKGDVDFQPSSVWLEQGVTNSKITDNEFNLGRTYNNGAVGINFVGAKGFVIKNTTVSDNKVTFTKDAFDDSNIVDDKGNVVGSGSVHFAVANGNRQGESPAAYGVEDVTAENNVIDGSALPRRDYGIAISNVKDATFTGNTITGTYMAVSYSAWNNQAPSSTGLTFNNNVLKDNTAAVYFQPQFAAGTMTPADFTYGANTVEVSKYAKSDPYVFGLAFTGWYDAQGNVATDQNAPAYANFVQVKDVVKFRGGQLRMDHYVANGKVDYSKTDLRFAYEFTMPQGATYDQASSGWKYGKGASVANDVTVSKIAQQDGVVRANLVLTGIATKQYNQDYSSLAYVGYTTVDGTKTYVYDGDGVQNRSVKWIVDQILDEGPNSPDYAYAKGLADALKADQQ